MIYTSPSTASLPVCWSLNSAFYLFQTVSSSQMQWTIKVLFYFWHTVLSDKKSLPNWLLVNSRPSSRVKNQEFSFGYAKYKIPRHPSGNVMSGILRKGQNCECGFGRQQHRNGLEAEGLDEINCGMSPDRKEKVLQEGWACWPAPAQWLFSLD